MSLIQTLPSLAPRRTTGRRARFAWLPQGTSALIMLTHLPLLAVQARLTWEYPHYRFFPAVPIAAGFVAVRGASARAAGSGARRRASWLLGASWALVTFACLIGSPWLGAVAALAAVPAVVYAIGGARSCGRCCRPLGFWCWRSRRPCASILSSLAQSSAWSRKQAARCSTFSACFTCVKAM